jgi:SRSO17 transposase
LRQALLAQGGQQLGQADGVLVFDPSAFPKSGHDSVGVARQWCGRLGKVDNCQVAIYLGYVSRKGHTLVALRLYLPKEWTQEKARLDKAGVPTARRGYRTRHQLALEMLETPGASLPHSWSAGDDEMGRPNWCRRRLATVGERYVLAVPSNTLMRALESQLPPSSGRGRQPTSGRGTAWRCGAKGSTRRPGSGSTCAMAPKGHWWSRWSHDVWCRGPIGVSKAMRNCWW